MLEKPNVGDVVQLNSSGPNDIKMTIVWYISDYRVKVGWLDVFGNYKEIEILTDALKDAPKGTV